MPLKGVLCHDSHTTAQCWNAEVLAAAERREGLACGALTKARTPCKRRDLYVNGRCKLHGGPSTGPKSPEGAKRSMANLKLRWRKTPAQERAREIAAAHRELREAKLAELARRCAEIMAAKAQHTAELARLIYGPQADAWLTSPDAYDRRRALNPLKAVRRRARRT
jgi:hypothetical protein